MRQEFTRVSPQTTDCVCTHLLGSASIQILRLRTVQVSGDELWAPCRSEVFYCRAFCGQGCNIWLCTDGLLTKGLWCIEHDLSGLFNEHVMVAYQQIHRWRMLQPGSSVATTFSCWALRHHKG
uniref:Uncharacterized protein n=1 Tax=Sphaerodactylus townsendi TaxID=933632 RepID=A0ACB8EWK7_9SAUR